MILGTDGRLGVEEAGGRRRSDTIILARLDADKSAITLMSIPRDLKVTIPGYALPDKINAAFANGGTALTLKTVKELLSTPDAPFKINHVVQVTFTGFRRMVDYLDCAYVDIDHHYFNDVGGPGGYAVIDIQPGYQKLCGADALDYVRYRHTDNDLIRGARQQDFIRQMLRQPGVRKRLSFASASTLPRSPASTPAPTSRCDESSSSSRCSSWASAWRTSRSSRCTFGDGADRRRRGLPDVGPDDAIAETLDSSSTRRPSPRRPSKTPSTRRSRPRREEARPSARRRSPSRPCPPASSTSTPAGRERGHRRSSGAGFPFYYPQARSHRRRTTSDGAARLHDRRARQAPPPGLPDGRRARIARRVLRHPGHDLERPADPRRPARHGRARRPQAARSTTTARGCGWSPGRPPRRLLGLQHAAARPSTTADGRHRRVARRASGVAARLLASPRFMSTEREPIGVIGTGTWASSRRLDSPSWATRSGASTSTPRRSSGLRAGEIPIWEPGLEELVAKHRERLHFSTDIDDALEHARLLFVAVGDAADVFRRRRPVGRLLRGRTRCRRRTRTRWS